MNNETTLNNNKQNLSVEDKAISLFKFIKELNALKSKPVISASDYPFFKSVDRIAHDSKHISVFYRDVEGEENVAIPSNILLSVQKPKIPSCPSPDRVFRDWLDFRWEDPLAKPKTLPVKIIPLQRTHLSEDDAVRLSEHIDRDRGVLKELFEDNNERLQAYMNWLEAREQWIDSVTVAKEAASLFADLYKICVDLERESEVYELIIANGFLRDSQCESVDHPLITRRVSIRHDAISNTIYIEDVDVETQIYTLLFQEIYDINSTAVTNLQQALSDNDYHPFDRSGLENILKSFINQLSSDGMYSKDGVPKDWKNEARFLMYQNPCLILRKRVDGAISAIEKIIAHIQEEKEVPLPIVDIVDGGSIDVPENVGEASVEEQLAAVGGESIDIYLSKQANREQLEIARRIENYNAVLVQGPPGTGKTHTIANLMGHFLAQGKSVLVTSHTKKALSVLKDKIDPALQDLCVSMLDDTNHDMEKSVDGITSYMADYTSDELKREMEEVGRHRSKVSEELGQVRRDLFTIISQESTDIECAGKKVSPSEAGAFLYENAERLSYIPGSIELRQNFPLSMAEVYELYQTNDSISPDDESELEYGIPSPHSILSPSDFCMTCDTLILKNEEIASFRSDDSWKVSYDSSENRISVDAPFGQIFMEYPGESLVNSLKSHVEGYSYTEPWMLKCVADGKEGKARKELWMRLIEQIEATRSLSDELTLKKFGKDVQILTDNPDLHLALKQLSVKFSEGGKVGKLAKLFNKNLEIALNGAQVDGHPPRDAAECELLIKEIEVDEQRKQCEIFWNELIEKNGGPSFSSLDINEPESVAHNYINSIKRYLNWYELEYEELVRRLGAVGLESQTVFYIDSFDSEAVAIEKIFRAIYKDIPSLCRLFEIEAELNEGYKRLNDMRLLLQTGDLIHSDVCKGLLKAIESRNVEAYRDAFDVLEKTYAKSNYEAKREEYLKRLTSFAPQWADAIRNRKGIHGESNVPEDVLDAVMWKQYCGLIDEITDKPFSELQQKSLRLSSEYRRVTAKYVEKCAWYNLLSRTECDINMKQDLIGWKQTVKKIGRGTGKNAPQYRAKARRLMARCQEAVPAWIMPVNKALETLDPGKNKFDIIIIDEASQSDISSLALLYMGKKLIIVGDDKQVTPIGVGVDVDKINSLRAIHIENVIPNDHLYDVKTSIYDIAATTFQPLMLREHFRCVPEIIGFSNMLSYDNKIKPLRDCSNNVLTPAIINYKVDNGYVFGKQNPEEAKAIVALMKACMNEPEYQGKTFGVISLLGNEQVKLIQREIDLNIDPIDVEERRIVCGNSSNFQGDERDVIFLSVVDAGDGLKPLNKRGFGPDDTYRKRYNVAVSRAKSQLWVVNSLDPATDLKPDDIRKTLLDYAANPAVSSMSVRSHDLHEESDFVASIVEKLSNLGYQINRNWQIGAYTLNVVVFDGINKAVIECDGGLAYCDENTIRNDMERQTILERLGWKFIRVRGSEYYRNPEYVIDSIASKLTELEINPASDLKINNEDCCEVSLFERVQMRAQKILKGDDAHDSTNDLKEFEGDIEGRESDKLAEHVEQSKEIDLSGEAAVSLGKKKDCLDTPVKHTYGSQNLNHAENHTVEDQHSLSQVQVFKDTNVEVDVSHEKQLVDVPNFDAYREHGSGKPIYFPCYEAADIEKCIEDFFPEHFQEMVEAILVVEAPLSEELLLRRIIHCFNRDSVTDEVYDNYRKLMRGCSRLGITRKNGFLYLEECNKYQMRAPGDIRRSIEFIAPEELGEGMLEILRCKGKMHKKELFDTLLGECGVKVHSPLIMRSLNEGLNCIRDDVNIKDRIVCLR